MEVSDGADTLSAANFARISALVKEYSGIKLPSAKQTMLLGRLRRRIRATQTENLDEYCEYLFDPRYFDQEFIHVVDAITTNKTDFFREPAHFDYLARRALPEMLAEGRSRVKIWSAACSTGAEPYTLAMVLETFAEAHRGFTYSVVATDLCTVVLEEARLGVFPEAMIEPVPAEMRRRHVLRSRDPDAGEVRMAPHLRSRVAFGRVNLMDDRYAVGDGFDVIFCRNVLIYFEKEDQNRVVGRLCANLRPGGLLVLGHSESIVGHALPLVTVANTIFRKV